MSEVRWRQVHAAGHLTQRALEQPSTVRREAGHRGLFISLGSEQSGAWDEQGAICPVAFDRDDPVWRDEVGFHPWKTYEIPLHDRISEARPLYTPWQLLPLLATAVRSADRIGRAGARSFGGTR